MDLTKEQQKIIVDMLVANHGDQSLDVVNELISRFRQRGDDEMSAAYEQIAQALLSGKATQSA